MVQREPKDGGRWGKRLDKSPHWIFVTGPDVFKRGGGGSD